jgi:hypothetical protein
MKTNPHQPQPPPFSFIGGLATTPYQQPPYSLKGGVTPPNKDERGVGRTGTNTLYSTH